MLSLMKKNIFTLLRQGNFTQFNAVVNKNFASILSIERLKEKRRNKLEEKNTNLNINNIKKEDKENKITSKSVKEIPIKNRIFENPQKALEILKTLPQKFPNQTIDMVVGLNIDPKRGDQVVRGIYSMPGGSNKIPKVCVFTSSALADLAKAAGADIIADAQTYKDISEGVINFDKTVCTLDTLPSLKNLGRTLGPLGLMPSTKVGTACTADNLQKIIKDLKMGSREFKTDIWGQVQIPVGKFDFSSEKILENIDSFMKAVVDKKPEAVKGRYLLYAMLYTYKFSFRMDIKNMDPKSSTYFMNK